MATWATPGDVTGLTGVTVSQAQLSIATGIIELVTGVTEQDMADGDARLPWLTRAVAYQAAFIHDHPDLFGALDVDRERLGDHTIDLRDGDPFAATLAPLAKIALARAGWDVQVQGTPEPPGPRFAFPATPQPIGDLQDWSTFGAVVLVDAQGNQVVVA